MSEIILHGSCVAVGGNGVLILGEPGAGKSSLALRLIDQPGCGISQRLREAQLVADDQVVLRRDGDRLLASAPPALAGKLEVRGLGIVEVAALAQAGVDLVVQLAPASRIARLPEAADCSMDILGMRRPMVQIDASQAGAPARVRAALDLFRP